jgi:hypothetical protein
MSAALPVESKKGVGATVSIIMGRLNVLLLYVRKF